MRFQNKVVLVTGGSSGIGAATALLVAKEGGNVVIVGRNEEKLKKIQEISEKNGNKVFAINGDVGKQDDAKRIIDTTVAKYGKLDVLVNNAGILRFGSILDGKLFDSYDEVLNVNLRAAIYMTTLAAPHLIKTKGNIVNVSSILGKSFLGKPAMTSYCVAKAGLDHFGKGASLELGEHGVRVNTVSPGPVKTDILENAGIPGMDWDREAQHSVLKRASDSEEVAKLISFLISDDAIGITGSDYVLDNGFLVKS